MKYQVNVFPWLSGVLPGHKNTPVGSLAKIDVSVCVCVHHNLHQDKTLPKDEWMEGWMKQSINERINFGAPYGQIRLFSCCYSHNSDVIVVLHIIIETHAIFPVRECFIHKLVDSRIKWAEREATSTLSLESPNLLTWDYCLQSGLHWRNIGGTIYSFIRQDCWIGQKHHLSGQLLRS